MSAKNLATVAKNFRSATTKNLRTFELVRNWSSHIGSIQGLGVEHQWMLIEYSFLKQFLAWEQFLEESFVLYVLGKKPTKARYPVMLVRPQNRTIAMSLITGDRPYADWTDVSKVAKRAKRFFLNGRPYDLITGNKRIFDEIKVVRNTIAHSSIVSRHEFENLVRQELLTLPHAFTPGNFLNTIVPTHSRCYSLIPGLKHPFSYIDVYTEFLLLSASSIVRF